MSGITCFCRRLLERGTPSAFPAEAAPTTQPSPLKGSRGFQCKPATLSAHNASRHRGCDPRAPLMAKGERHPLSRPLRRHACCGNNTPSTSPPPRLDLADSARHAQLNRGQHAEFCQYRKPAHQKSTAPTCLLRASSGGAHQRLPMPWGGLRASTLHLLGPSP